MTCLSGLGDKVLVMPNLFRHLIRLMNFYIDDLSYEILKQVQDDRFSILANLLYSSGHYDEQQFPKYI